MITDVTLCLVIPLSMVVEAVMTGHGFPWFYYVGAAGVVYSVVAINLADYLNKEDEQAKASIEVDSESPTVENLIND